MLYEGCVIRFLNAVAVIVVDIADADGDATNDRDDGSEDFHDDYELS